MNENRQSLSTEQAVLRLRNDPGFRDLVHFTYLDSDVLAATNRFLDSGEWRATLQLLTEHIFRRTVLDLGAGIGMASSGFIRAGASRVIAVEPDPSVEIGRGAITRVCAGLSVQTVAAYGEALPFPDESVDLVYARQVLHHTRDLNACVAECARILRPGGCFFVCREHVANTADELRRFLAAHPIHRLTGGEHAYSLAAYMAAIASAGLQLDRCIDPWDSVINLFPAVMEQSDIENLPARRLREHFGRMGSLASQIPGVCTILSRWMRRPRPGRLYSFLASKP